MADDIGIRFEGSREFRRALRNLGDDLEDLKTAHSEGAEIVADRATQIVPMVTGELRDTIRSAGTKTRGLVRAGFARTPYAGPIHFGWPAHGITPQPFLYEAMDDRRDEVLDVYHDRVTALARRRGLDVRKAIR